MTVVSRDKHRAQPFWVFFASGSACLLLAFRLARVAAARWKEHPHLGFGLGGALTLSLPLGLLLFVLNRKEHRPAAQFLHLVLATGIVFTVFCLGDWAFTHVPS